MRRVTFNDDVKVAYYNPLTTSIYEIENYTSNLSATNKVIIALLVFVVLALIAFAIFAIYKTFSNKNDN